MFLAPLAAPLIKAAIPSAGAAIGQAVGDRVGEMIRGQPPPLPTPSSEGQQAFIDRSQQVSANMSGLYH